MVLWLFLAEDTFLTASKAQIRDWYKTDDVLRLTLCCFSGKEATREDEIKTVEDGPESSSQLYTQATLTFKAFLEILWTFST